MKTISKSLTEMGLSLIPFSFAGYFPYRWLEYFWQKGYSKLIKGIWYLCMGTMYVSSSIEVNTVITYICFIEAWDLFFEQLEKSRARKIS